MIFSKNFKNIVKIFRRIFKISFRASFIGFISLANLAFLISGCSDTTDPTETPPALDPPIGVILQFAAINYIATEGGLEATVRVTLSADPRRAVIIPLIVITNETITNRASTNDYRGLPASLSFAPGQTNMAFPLIANNDATNDGDKILSLGFGPLPEKVITGLQATSTVRIIDNDSTVTPLPEVSVGFATNIYSLTEGTNVPITVALSADPERTLVIGLSVTLGDETSLDDYRGVPPLLVFTNGQTNMTFSLTASDDVIDESNEMLVLGFTNLADRVSTNILATSTVTIIDNDDPTGTPPPTITVQFATNNYEATESGIEATVMVILNADPERTVIIPLIATTNGISTNAASTNDYRGIPASLSFAPGETNMTFSLIANHDATNDGDKIFMLGFGSPLPDRITNGIPATATVTIIDGNNPIDPTPGEPPPAITVQFTASNYMATEAGLEAIVEVTLNSNAQRALIIPLVVITTNGIITNRASTNDYRGIPASLSFVSGQTNMTFSIIANNDAANDGDKILSLGFGLLPDRVTPGTQPTTTITIIDNDDPSDPNPMVDPPPEVMVRFATNKDMVAEGANIEITVTLNADPERTLILPLATTLNGASPNDYRGVPPLLVFTNGQTNMSFILTASEDRLNENTEMLVLGFSNLPAGVSTNALGTTTITISDGDVPQFSLTPTTANAREGDPVILTVRADIAPVQDVELSLNLTGDGADIFGALPQTFTIPAGEIMTNFIVTILDDATPESAENLVFTLSSAVPELATISDTTDMATITIIASDLRDADGDDVPDTADVDDDNDGLIEIYSLTMLHNMRYNLAGTSYISSEGAVTNTNGAPVSGLNGYELVSNLSFDTDGDGTWTVTTNGGNPVYSLDDNDSHPTYFPVDSMAGGWLPIGNVDTPFGAIFEGNNNTITGLAIRRDQTNVGMFGQIDDNADIRNLGLLGNLADYMGSSGDAIFVGGLVGQQNGGSITACYATGNADGGTENEDEVGGLVGGQEAGIIATCYATGNADGGNGQNDNVGGLVGRKEGGNITASYATGNPDGGDGNSDSVGGLVGQQNAGSITASYATGDANGGTGAEDDVGGLVGVQERGNITASYSTGNADGGDGNRDAVGGLVGVQGGDNITASYSTGNADGGTGGNDNVGSLVGLKNAGNITASYGFGNVANVGTAGSDGNMKPDDARGESITSANELTAANAGTEWNDADNDTLGAWDFDTGSSPILRYADYDGTGTDFTCENVTLGLPDGSLIRLTCGTSLLPEQW